VVFVEFFRNRIDVVLGIGASTPGQIRDPLQVVPNHIVFGLLRRKSLQAVELPFGDVLGFFGQIRFFDTFAQSFDVAFALVVAQFLFDGAQLFAQNRFFLLIADFTPHVLLDLALDLREGLLLQDKPGQKSQSFDHVERFEDPYVFVGRKAQDGRQTIGETARVFIRGCHANRIFDSPPEFADLVEQRPRKKPSFFGIAAGFFHGRDIRRPIRIELHQITELQTRDPFDHQTHVSARHPPCFHDARVRAQAKHVIDRWIHDCAVFLRHHANHIAFGQSAHEREGSFTTDRERDYSTRKENTIAKREYRNCGRGQRRVITQRSHRETPSEMK